MSTCKEEYKNIIAVTNRKLSSRPFLEQMERVCRLQPKAVILREKDLQEEMYEELAVKVIELCKQYQVPCMLHTYLETARKLQHPYIHLPLFLLRENSGKLNDFVEIGCSIHSVEEAEEAQKLGATYLTAGHIYTTDCNEGTASERNRFPEGSLRCCDDPGVCDRRDPCRYRTDTGSNKMRCFRWLHHVRNDADITVRKLR